MTEERQSVLQEALHIVRQITYQYDKREALKAIAPQVSPEDSPLLQEALNIARQITNEDYKTEVLIAIAPPLSQEDEKLGKNFLNIAFELENKENRIKVLTDIAFQHTELLIQQSTQIQLSTIIEIVPQGKTSENKSRLLSALAPHLSSDLLPRALELIQTDITHPVFQAESLSNLAPYLSSELLTEALDLVKNDNDIVGYTYPTDALCSLIPYLNCDQLIRVLEVASERKLEHPKLLTPILQTAATRFNILVKMGANSKPEDIKNKENELIDEILAKTQQHINEESSIYSIFTKFIAVVKNNNQLAIIQEIFNQLKIQHYKAQIIAELTKSADLTPIQLAKQAKNLTQAIPKAIALTAFILIDPNFREQVIELRDNSQFSYPEMQIALILATRTHPQESDTVAIAELRSDQSQALRLIRRLKSDYDKAETLVQLAPHLLPNLSIEAESIAQDIEQPYHRIRSLIALSDYFPSIRSAIFSHLSKVEEEDKCEYIELLSQFATIIPEKISDLIKKLESESVAAPAKNNNQPYSALKSYEIRTILVALKPHLTLRLDREIDRQTCVGLAPAELLERSVFLLCHEYRQALKSGTIRNDADFDEDLLNLKDEINALTEMLLMRDLSPPVTVGILGG